MKHRTTSTVVGIILLASLLFSQESVHTSQAPDSTPSNPANTGLTLVFSARSNNGSVDLTTSDIEAKEDGTPVLVQKVQKLNRPPLRYCVLFDKSNSQRASFKFQQDVAAGLLQQVLRPNFDHGWLALFDVASEESNDTDAPQAIVSAIRSAGPSGPTALYDAVARCASRMEANSLDTGTRVMFLFSDGGDTQSRITGGEAGEAAARANIRIYAIDPGKDSTSAGSTVLKKLAESTGGRALFPERSKDIPLIIAEVNDDLENLFLLTLDSGNSKPGKQILKIELKCKREGVTILAPKRVYSSRP